MQPVNTNNAAAAAQADLRLSIKKNRSLAETVNKNLIAK